MLYPFKSFNYKNFYVGIKEDGEYEGNEKDAYVAEIFDDEGNSVIMYGNIFGDKGIEEFIKEAKETIDGIIEERV